MQRLRSCASGRSGSRRTMARTPSRSRCSRTFTSSCVARSTCSSARARRPTRPPPWSSRTPTCSRCPRTTVASERHGAEGARAPHGARTAAGRADEVAAATQCRLLTHGAAVGAWLAKDLQACVCGSASWIPTLAHVRRGDPLRHDDSMTRPMGAPHGRSVNHGTVRMYGERRTAQAQPPALPPLMLVTALLSLASWILWTSTSGSSVPPRATCGVSGEVHFNS
mmetsp:Transcript_23524/g.60138  ORF Transcript_23524/g.60138 Transcript_23524/m.60138 type:complete len:224 (+) Transcript_23524:1921-2592(+)